MARRSSRSRRLRSHSLTKPDRKSEHDYGLPAPKRLREAIERERDNLSKVESLLACMVVSMEYQNDPLEGPYYPAVAQLARELVAKSIDGLDPSVLRERLLRNKIEEVFCVSFLDPRSPTSESSRFNASDQRLAA